MIRKFSAHIIFPVSGPPLKFGKIVCDSNGHVLEILETKGRFKEEPFLEFYDGIIVPGFLSPDKEDDFVIFNRIKDMQNEEPAKSLELLIHNVTLGMAQFLNCDHLYGSIQVSKKPGINLISGVDFGSLKLTPKSQLKILIPR